MATFSEKGDYLRSIFWEKISHCDHMVQIYEDDDSLLDALEGFAAGGLRNDEGVLVIATPEHREALEKRLRALGLNLDSAKAQDQFIALDAAETLALFADRDGLPDEDRFRRTAMQALRRARGAGRRVRAFGEMVALLWEQDRRDATVRLERLWHSLCDEQSFALFCAYPASGLSPDERSAREIRSLHTRVIPG